MHDVHWAAKALTMQLQESRLQIHLNVTWCMCGFYSMAASYFKWLLQWKKKRERGKRSKKKVLTVLYFFCHRAYLSTAECSALFNANANSQHFREGGPRHVPVVVFPLRVRNPGCGKHVTFRGLWFLLIRLLKSSKLKYHMRNLYINKSLHSWNPFIHILLNEKQYKLKA